MCVRVCLYPLFLPTYFINTSVTQPPRHPESALKLRKPVGTYKRVCRHPIDREFEDLIKLFETKGFYTTDWVFYFKKTLVALGFLVAALICVLRYEHWAVHYLGGALLALFWQQSGFIMHELMHGQVFRNRFWDHTFALIYGTIPFGMSASWWHDEHVIHHGMTNVVDVDKRFVDPQMWENVWAQHPKLFPLFR